MHFIDGFPQNEVWLDETLQEILKVWDKKCPIIFSFHGTPQNWVASGDPYSLDCEAEVDWFRRKLTAKNPDARIYITYQSRFGPLKWLGPYSTALAEEFGQKHEDLLVVCPSFMVDKSYKGSLRDEVKHGSWEIDQANPNRVPDGQGGENSVKNV